MNKSVYKIFFCVFLLLFLIASSYAFFNYTRKGETNNIKVGGINFNSNYTGISLSNVHPISMDNINNDSNNVKTISIRISGNTTYSGGIEYLVSISDDNIIVNNKSVPISIITTANNLGTASDSYFDLRGGNSSYYKILANNIITPNEKLVVGYIAPNTNDVNGEIQIKCFLDQERVSVSDIYDNNVIVNNNAGDGRVVLTSTEWNSLHDDGLSFKIKIEANEGIWVARP